MGCSTCGKKVQQNIGKPKSNNGYMRGIGTGQTTSPFGRPKIRFNKRDR